MISFNIILLSLSFYIIFANIFSLLDSNFTPILSSTTNGHRITNIFIGFGTALGAWDMASRGNISKVNNVGVLIIFIALLANSSFEIAKELLQGLNLSAAFALHIQEIINIPLFTIVLTIQIYEIFFKQCDRAVDRREID